MRWVVIVSVVSTAVLLHSTARAEAGTAYYINNQAGSNCSESGPGTSPATPWCDFTPVNSRTFGPGDRILLARRATWDQQMTLNGSGAPTDYASVDAYGSGPLPRIIRDGNESDRAIRMNDPSYWRVSNLEIGSAGTGILVYFNTLNHTGLQFINIYVHDIRGIHQGDTASGQADRIWNSAGIEITGLVTATSAQYALSDVTLSNIEGTHNMDTISLDWFNGLGTTGDGDGAVHSLLSMSYPTGAIRDNLYDEPAGFLTSADADFNAFTVTNNIRVSASLISNAAHDFSSTQGVNDWSYQYSADGTTWT